MASHSVFDLTESQKAENEARWVCDDQGYLPPQWDGDNYQRFESASQLYEGNHCRFSSGLVVNPSHAPDVIYLILERGHPSRDDYERVEKHVRPDEAAALVHLLSGALFSWSMQRVENGLDGE